MHEQCLICSEQRMKAFGAALLASARGAGIITLQGDLGTGKTTLVRGALESLGYTRGVRSPTYTLVEFYPVEPFSIAHFDLYRLADPEELEFLGFRDYVDGDTLCFIEWPERAAGLLENVGLRVGLEYRDQCRSLSLYPGDDWGRRIVDAIDCRDFS